MNSRPPRWVVPVGASAVLITLAALIAQGTSPPHHTAEEAPSASGRTVASAASTPAVASPAPASATAAVEPQGTAAPAAAAPPVAPPPAPPVGAEGYGPRIQQAIDGTSADEALWAARRMRECAEAGWNEQALKTGARHSMGPAQVVAMIEADRAETRRCQTVTPQLMAQRAALARRAAQAGVADAAWEWSDALGASYHQAPPQEHLPDLRDALRADANRCSQWASSLIALSDKSWGFSDTERGMHLRANQTNGGFAASSRMVMRFDGPYRPELQSLPGVEAAAQDYLARCASQWLKLG